MEYRLSPRENMLLAYTHHCPERFPAFPADAGGGRVPPEIRERAPGDGSMAQMHGGTGYDWFGVHWIFQPEIGAGMIDPAQPPLLDDITAWRETVHFPDLDAVDWAAAAARYEPAFAPGKLRRMTVLMGPFERLHSLMGMAGALCALVTEPEACREFFEAVVDHKIRLIGHIVPRFRLDCVECHDDWGHQGNSFFSPASFRALLVPPMRRLVDFCRSLGVLYEHHSCGYIENLLPSVVDEIGIGVWSSCQAINDIPKIAREYGGRLTMIGGFDCPELAAMDDAAARAFLGARVEDICRGGTVIPYMAKRMRRERALLAEVLAERGDFYTRPENRLPPH